MTKRIVVLLGLIVVVFVLSRHAGSFLVVNHPEHADAIVVLAGGNNDLRYWNGVELLQQGWAPRLMLDVFAKGETFGNRDIDLATEFAKQNTPGPWSICPLILNSTYDEARHIAECLRGTGVKSILVVTSAYHTRRALDILQKRLADYHVSIYAAPDPYFFGEKWWQTREWAKTTLAEWQRYTWWVLVDRWRKDVVIKAS